MANPNPDQPRRRFAPVPIETTFESVRKSSSSQKPPRRQQEPQPPPPPPPHQQVGPNPELTPEPSPRSPSPVPPELRERRRFAPQLIETSRRARRVGDSQPATKPADKTDITPYTKHIYAAKPRHRRKHDDGSDDEPLRHMPPTRRETEDEGVKEYLLELAAKEAERQIQEAALAAFPNSRAREGGVAHFYFRESSGSDESPDSASPADRSQSQSRARRKSSNLGLSWWHQHMQEHAQHLAKEHGVDEVAVEEDTLMRSDSDLDMMDLSAPPDPLWTTSRAVSPKERRESMEDAVAAGQRKERQAADHPMPDSPSAAAARGPEAGYPPAPQAAPESPFGRPFGGFGAKPEDPKTQKMRQMASPPMLGGDLTFRRCPSPKLTKLEPDHPFVQPAAKKIKHQDTSGQGGLWRGYCFRTDSDQDDIVPADLQPPAMLATPHGPSPGELENGSDTQTISAEPTLLYSAGVSTAEHRGKNGQARGLHMLSGVDEKLRRQKAAAEKDERIAQEFDDHFVTQVYNYLSLGYPATAHAYDEELSRISRVDVGDLKADDRKQMAKGHMLEMNLEETPEEQRCPRWKALRVYIIEWARQHGDLDSLDPLAWGVRERRGSWAI